jgi:hypothetical protein
MLSTHCKHQSLLELEMFPNILFFKLIFVNLVAYLDALSLCFVKNGENQGQKPLIVNKKMTSS